MIKIEDLSLRDGMQQLNIPKTYNKQQEIFKILMNTEVNSIEFRMLDDISDLNFLNECIDYIQVNKINKTITLLVILTDKYIKFLDKITNKKCVNIKILFPFSKIHFQYKINSNRLEYCQKINQLCESNFKSLYNSIQIILEDVTSVSLHDAQEFMKIILDINHQNFDYIILADTKGQMLPGEIFELVKWYIDNYPKQQFGVHCHNDLGLATANTIFAIEAGIKKVEGCFLGIGERAGNVALEQMMLISNQKYQSNYNIDNLIKTLKELSTIYNISTGFNSVLIGEGYNKHTSGIHQNAEIKSKGLYSFVKGLEYEMPLNPLSSKEIIKDYYNSDDFVSFYRNVNKYLNLDNEKIKKLYIINEENNEKIKY